MSDHCKHCRAALEATPTRRQLMTGAAAVLAASALSVGRAKAATDTIVTPQNVIPPPEALDRLMTGNARYAANTPNERDFSHDRAERATAQYPIAAVLSCADSRVSPELLFDQGPGDVFVVRLAGNFLDDDGFASLEYAVKFLGAPLVMILGHTNCGAIDAAIKVVKERIELPGHLPELIKSIEPAVIAAHARHPSDLLAAATEENVRLNMKRLVDNEPIMTEPLAEKKLAIAGGVYDIATGKVNLLT
ncbi:MAG TPA: carbonic anhydrase [Methyloceanibacter sp.]|jgi:carbonic anhydrase|nr:carbonic anhydrase [Methyloceanibacter sp.]